MKFPVSKLIGEWLHYKWTRDDFHMLRFPGEPQRLADELIAMLEKEGYFYRKFDD